ncbi:hypothetical protein Pmani_023893 [Petrolisthes manimaculis]|uniref:Uncharacterized protein n=1 Tax=Petrolisthes manimaculis TaxID=1843537 RepID=A0AAE1U2X6_9EUCA|nr:hypothetical protein Pmani_023893 [Petrolisthes manimaculis]
MVSVDEGNCEAFMGQGSGQHPGTVVSDSGAVCEGKRLDKTVCDNRQVVSRIQDKGGGNIARPTARLPLTDQATVDNAAKPPTAPSFTSLVLHYKLFLLQISS